VDNIITSEMWDEWARMQQTQDFILSLKDLRQDSFESMLTADEHRTVKLKGYVMCVDSVIAKINDLKERKKENE
jgi:hypothetical protein